MAELAGKTDVKGRARARAEDLRDRAGAMTVQLRSTAARAGEQRVPLVLAGVGAGAVVAAGVWWGAARGTVTVPAGSGAPRAPVGAGTCRYGRIRTTCGSWSLTWLANSALMCTTS